MKPKMYRKTKKTSRPNKLPWDKNKGGGTVKGVIVGPESSVGSSEIAPPSVEQGNDKGGTNVETS